MKSKINVKHESLEEINSKELKIDDNLTGFDPENQREQNLTIQCFKTYHKYREIHNNAGPKPWNPEDIDEFEKLAKNDEIISNNYIDKDKMTAMIKVFGATCSGYFPPLAAFFGGFAAQEIIKAVTHKFIPLNQMFSLNAKELIISELNPVEELKRIIESNSIKDSNKKVIDAGGVTSKLTNVLEEGFVE